MRLGPVELAGIYGRCRPVPLFWNPAKMRVKILVTDRAKCYGVHLSICISRSVLRKKKSTPLVSVESWGGGPPSCGQCPQISCFSSMMASLINCIVIEIFIYFLLGIANYRGQLMEVIVLAPDYQWTRTKVSSCFCSCCSKKLAKSLHPISESSSIQTTEPIVKCHTIL